jgi:hypothetical protein
MQEAVAKTRVNFPEMTELVVYTDRMPLYPGPIFSMYTGGFEMYPYPTYHVTWEGVKTSDFAAFVTVAGSAHLRVRLYNFGTDPMAVRARLWRLAPGAYRVIQEDDVGAQIRVSLTYWNAAKPSHSNFRRNVSTI